MFSGVCAIGGAAPCGHRKLANRISAGGQKGRDHTRDVQILLVLLKEIFNYENFLFQITSKKQILSAH